MPYIVDADGEVRILLITSRQTGRWVVPKGNPIAGLAPHEAAAQEAWEEAGVRGTASPTPLGSFHYLKRRRGGVVKATVRLFPMAVTEQHDDWPERGQRRLQWLSPAKAAEAVEDVSLKGLIAGFRVPPDARASPSARRLTISRKPERGSALRRWLRTVARRADLT